MDFKIGDNLKVLEGVYTGFGGKVISLADKDVSRRIGAQAFHPKGKAMPPIIWFKENEVETAKDERKNDREKI